jgi:hypothetical protein
MSPPCPIPPLMPEKRHMRPAIKACRCRQCELEAQSMA